MTSPYRRVLLSFRVRHSAAASSASTPTSSQHRQPDRGRGRVRVQVAIVTGGGNFFRGAGLQTGMDRSRADYMGMLGTVMNCLAAGLPGADRRPHPRADRDRHGPGCRAYIPRRAIRHWRRAAWSSSAQGRACRTSTDTVAAQRALEIGAGTTDGQATDGVYDADPHTNPDANRFDELTYDDFLARDLKVADATAVSLAREHQLPMIFFDLGAEGNIAKVVAGEKIGTTLHA